MGKQIVSAAPGGGGVTWEDWKGKLAVIEPLEIEKDIKTDYGETDAVRANVYFVLSADGSKSESFEDTLIFPKVLQSQTRRQIGSIVVGRVAQGEAKKGQNPPWTLAEATEKDLKAAGAFWSSKSISGASSAGDGDEGFDEGDEGDEEDAF